MVAWRPDGGRLRTFPLTLLLSGCSLLTVKPTPCTANLECREAFGLGTVCGGEGLCEVTEIPPRCATTDPPGLQLPVDPSQTLVVGTMFDHTLDTHVGRYRSAELAQSQANANGGLDGRLFAMVHCTIEEGFPADGLPKAEATVEVATWLADALGVPAIVGPAASGDTEIVYATVAGLGTLVISPSATSPSLTPLDGLSSTDASPGLLWRTAPPDSVQGVAIAWDMTVFRDPVDRSFDVAVVYQTGPYGEGLEQTFTDAMNARGGTTTGFPFDSALGPGDAIADVNGGNFEEVLFISSEAGDVVSFLLAVDQLALDLPIFLTDGARNADVLADARAAGAQDLFPLIRGTAPASPAGAVYDSFAASYASEHGGADVSLLSYTAQAFDASWLVMYGHAWATYREGGVSGLGIARGLRQVSSGPDLQLRPTSWNEARARFQAGESVDVIGASGALDYDPTTGETVAPIEVWRILGDDDFETVTVYEP
jgi:ABC-type branched-subunit amino acid transport system substrate-binding protein